MLLMVKDIIEKRDTNKTAICFALQSVLEMLYDLRLESCCFLGVIKRRWEQALLFSVEA